MDLQELLDHRGIEYRKTNNPAEILIACTSGEHIDKSPSLSYNLEKNMFHCWSCNFSGGITKFMKSIGETVHIDVDSKQPYKIKKLKEKLHVAGHDRSNKKVNMVKALKNLMKREKRK